MPGDEGVEEVLGDGFDPSDPSAPAAAFRSVFLSYASHDAEAADSICRYLESHGASCWIAPRDVKAGAQYADAIVRAINEATAVVLVLSGSAVGSDHVAREVERAASKHKQIIAFRIDTAPLVGHSSISCRTRSGSICRRWGCRLVCGRDSHGKLVRNLHVESGLAESSQPR